MALGNMTRRVIWLALLATLILAASAMNSPNEPLLERISAYVGDTTAKPGSTNTPISVFMDNNNDTIVGFILHITLFSEPDVMAFQTDSGIDIDTTYWRCVSGVPPNCTDCVSVPKDSLPWHYTLVDTFDVLIGNFDTTGTLLAGWEYIRTRSSTPSGKDLTIYGFADVLGGPVKQGILPQQGGRLIKLLADIGDVPDTLSDRLVYLEVHKKLPLQLDFTTSSGHFFWDSVAYWDTNGWVCTQWSVDNSVTPPETLGCGSYLKTSAPPWDSTAVVLAYKFVLDTSEVHLFDGTLQVLPGFLCGDLNGDDRVGTILDLNFLVNKIFRNGPRSDPPEASDLNCDGSNGTILDLNKLVNKIFRGGSAVCTGPGC